MSHEAAVGRQVVLKVSYYKKSVFLNVPYDKEYAPLFTALIAGLVALGRIEATRRRLIAK